MKKIVLLWLILSDIGLEAATQFSKEQTYLLPWEMITEQFSGSTSLWGGECVINRSRPQNQTTGAAKINNSRGYACQPDKSITICLPITITNIGSLNKLSAIYAKYDKNSWQKINEIKINSEQNIVKIIGGMGKEGFFKFSCAIKGSDGEPHNFDAYAIVCKNWKKDILAFCREHKEDIELNPDAQLIRSSITTSHFDHAMKLISKAVVLSEDVLRALNEAIINQRDFEEGEYPNLVLGLNKIRLKRFEGSPIEEFVVLVPDNYSKSKSWPVTVHPDMRRWGTRDNYPAGVDMIEVWWHTVSFKDLRWKDFNKVMEMVTNKLNVDEDRVYVEGKCRNGVDAAAMALNYPDYWAECSIELGNSYRYLAGNTLNLPLIFVKGGGHDDGSYVGFYNYTVKCFQYHDCRYVKHSSTQSMAQARGIPIPVAVREKSPRRVLYTIESLGNSKAYWVKINGREDENLLGTIDASVDGQKILVKTSNVDAYSLDLVCAPLDSNKPVEILEDGQSLGFVKERVFTKQSEKYINAAFIKNDLLHGPVWDAFTDPYVVVYGTGGSDMPFVKTSRNIAEKLAGGAPCLADLDMPKEMISGHNLILVGSVESNYWLALISGKLPLRIRPGQACATKGKVFDGNDLGFFVIYPNPMNPDKYVVIYSATSGKAMAYMFNAYLQMKSSIPADVGIYEVTKQGGIKWHILERLNTVWNWHEKYEKVLLSVGRDHPKWQWKQWVANVVKKQMSVDVVICEDHLRNFDVLSPGEKTYRDLFNAFQNAWFTKVKIEGRSLRAVLMVPFGSISKREMEAPVIDGICLAKKPMAARTESLVINELGDETIYTVAFSEKCLNGQRIGLVIQDYDIVDQKYLMPMLEKYLLCNSELDIDSQLDSLKLDIF